MKVFLGGTVNGSLWRDRLIPHLDIDYFNPVVDTWTDEAYQRELKERETADYCLYVITPRARGFYSIAEVADDSNKRPDKTIYTYLEEEGGIRFDPHQLKSLEAIGKMVADNGGHWLKNLDEVAQFLNSSQGVPLA